MAGVRGRGRKKESIEFNVRDRFFCIFKATERDGLEWRCVGTSV